VKSSTDSNLCPWEFRKSSTRSFPVSPSSCSSKVDKKLRSRLASLAAVFRLFAAASAGPRFLPLLPLLSRFSPTLQIVVDGPTIPDKGGRGNPEVFARFRFVSELSKSSRYRIPCDFVRQYLVSQARLSREGACILNCFPLPRCNSLKTADQRTCSEDLATGTWPSEPPASRQAVRMTQSNISYQSGVPNPNGTHT
jgi:hypothetical protein